MPPHAPRPARLCVAIAALVLAGALAGCQATVSAPPDLTSHAPAQAPGAAAPTAPAVPEMSVADKHAHLGADFVAEWPVAAGTVTAVNSKRDELRFTMQVAAPATTVAAWYRTTMQDRSFSLTAEKADDDGSIDTLTFWRAGDYFVIRIEALGDSAARVSTALGIYHLPKLD